MSDTEQGGHLTCFVQRGSGPRSLFWSCLAKPESQPTALSKSPSEKEAKFRSRKSFHDWQGRAKLRSNGDRRTSRYPPRGSPGADQDLACRNTRSRSRDHLSARHDGDDIRRTDSDRRTSRGMDSPAYPTRRTRRRGRAETAILWHALLEIVSTQRSHAADDLPGPRPEFFVGRVRSHDPLAGGSRLRDRGVRLPVQPEHRRVMPAIGTRLGRVSRPGQGQAAVVDRGALDGRAPGKVPRRRRYGTGARRLARSS